MKRGITIRKFRGLLWAGLALSLLAGLIGFGGVAINRFAATPVAAATTIIVNTTTDLALAISDGKCSLREAIRAANTNAPVDACPAGSPGLDNITFALGAGAPSISIVNSALPAITEPVNINGATGGATRVEIKGQFSIFAGPVDGLKITAGGSTISALVINGFTLGGIHLSGGGGNKVKNCYLGTNAAGTSGSGTSLAGINIENSPNNTIGGATAGERNVISNHSAGVYISGSGSTNNIVIGNYIGTNAAGTAKIANGAGVVIDNAPNNTVGGTTAGRRNVISGSSTDGVLISNSGATGNDLIGNYIGTNAAGTASLGNGRDGVRITNAQKNAIGGTLAGAPNLISRNGGDGVSVSGGGATANSILGNSIYANGASATSLLDLGIDLKGTDGVTANDAGDADAGPNGLRNFPVLNCAISGGGQTVVQGSLSSQTSKSLRIEFFANTSCDAAGHGEGETYLGFRNVATDASGNVAFTATLATTVAAGKSITATATGLNAGVPSGTSEFSACVTVIPRPTVSINDVTLAEGNAGATNFVFTVTLNGAQGVCTPVTVNYTTANQTATANSDYTLTAGTLTFNPPFAGNSLTQTITVPVSGDQTLEPTETFALNLSGAAGATIADNQGLGTILNDDGNIAPPIVTVAFSPDAIVAGDASAMSITIANPDPAVVLTGVALTNALPAGVTTVAGTAANSCGGTATQTANSVSLNGGVIPAGGACTLTAQVTSVATGVYTNTINPGAVATANGVTNLAPASATLTVNCPPSITINPASLPDGTLDSPYSQMLSATPGGANCNFQVISGALPTGLSLNAATGLISGSPTTLGAYNFTVRATCFGACAGTQAYTMTIVAGAFCTTPTFTAPTNFGVGTDPRSVAVGDFNLDGKPDLAVANFGSNNVSVRLGNGTGGFGALTNFGVGTNPWSVAMGDFNLDGKPDLAVANFGSNNVSVRLGNGAGGFGAVANFSMGTSPRSVAVGDFNLDGKPDLAVANGSNSVSVRLGNGTGGFGAVANFSVGTNPISVAVSDFNLDGKPDLAVVNIGSANVSVRLGDGTGGFGAVANFSVGSSPIPVAVGDFNLDGKPDLAVANRGSNSVSVRLGNGTGGFGAVANFSMGSNPNSVAVGDFNLDGKPDLAVANFGSNNVSVRLGNGTGGFGAVANFSEGIFPASVAVGDFNLDGKLDLAVANGSANVSVRLNSCPATPPASAVLTAALPTSATASGSPTAGGEAEHQEQSPVKDGKRAFATFGDFDGDGQTDFAVWRGETGQWLIVRSGDGENSTEQWGAAGDAYHDVIAPGDYDGDGRFDPAVFRRADGHWHIKLSSDGQTIDKLWGLGTDTPVPGDYDGDGRTDIAVWRGQTGEWLIARSSDGETQTVSWGASSAPYLDAPVPADYDGDGQTDIAVFRRGLLQGAHWYIRQSSDGQVVVKQWGVGSDTAVPADYDGDGKADIAVWRGPTGEWHILRSSGDTAQTVTWGTAQEGDVPVPGDYDGDGQTDIAIWRAADGSWSVKCSRDDLVLTKAHGWRGDTPGTARSN